MKTKLLLLIVFSLCANSIWALDRFVDPNLSSGNGTTLFTTISSAVSAASNGDRILIVAGTYNEPTLTLGKSLTLLSQNAGSIINYNGNIVIAGFPGMKLEILGFDLGVYSITSNVITGGSATNRAKVSVIDCKMKYLTIDQDYYDLNCIKNKIANVATFRFGSFVTTYTDSLNINDEPNSNITTDKILIVADTVQTWLGYRNDDFPTLIANSLIGSLYFWKWNNLINKTNYVRNNLFLPNARLLVAENPPSYNFEFSSNQFGPNTLFFTSTSISGCGPFQGPAGPSGLYGGTECVSCSFDFNVTCVSFSEISSLFPNPTKPGFFKWIYNGIDLPCTVPTGSQPLVLTKIIGPTGTTIDAGNPNHDYYDIDLTINDRGITGGPYSINNYYPTINPSNGKAFIFDLDMPTDLFPGQQVDIKAKGYHKN